MWFGDMCFLSNIMEVSGTVLVVFTKCKKDKLNLKSSNGSQHFYSHQSTPASYIKEGSMHLLINDKLLLLGWAVIFASLDSWPLIHEYMHASSCTVTQLVSVVWWKEKKNKRDHLWLNQGTKCVICWPQSLLFDPQILLSTCQQDGCRWCPVSTPWQGAAETMKTYFKRKVSILVHFKSTAKQEKCVPKRTLRCAFYFCCDVLICNLSL